MLQNYCFFTILKKIFRIENKKATPKKTTFYISTGIFYLQKEDINPHQGQKKP
ncbi:Hypothetical protein Ccan_04010 [Capnocytophaga canimorsus Cc5]|uniref:Uncharacterized protein n=1 Tax=Capnocytophaga canimorsus (strain 5) TaxID=860228 RepID=F9YRP4_CAPCC|nr:Hypothetical protein Ccan_04010 [Capnocytophaga canimorsus Cc5]